MGPAALFDDVMREVFTRTVTAVNACGSDIVERASAALAVFYDVIISDAPRAWLYAEAAGVAAGTSSFPARTTRRCPQGVGLQVGRTHPPRFVDDGLVARR